MSDWRKTACILCSENCGLEVKIEGGRIKSVRGDDAHPESRGYLCQKAARLDRYQNHVDRLDSPLERQADGSLKRVSWDHAIAGVARGLRRLRETHGGQSVAYYGGGGQGNHLGGVYGASLREAIGTPYIYSALAQEKTGDFWVNGQLFGRQTCHVATDVSQAEVVLFLGTNPFQSHGFPRARRVLNEIHKDPARTMIVIDPRATETARLADLHLQVRPGHDAFLLAALLGALVEEDLYDRAFLARRCRDSEPVLAALREVPVDAFATRSGVDPAVLRGVARTIAGASSVAVRADLGIQQSRHSTLNSYLEKLLFLLSGHFGKPGCNSLHSFLIPLIGHSPEPESESSIKTRVTGMHAISKLYPPNVLPAEIDTEHPERIRGLIVDSSNPIMSGADTAAYRAAFAKLELCVVIDVALTETAQFAHYVLPASSQFEKTEATFFNLGFPTNAFHLRRAVLPQRPGTLPESEIYRRLCVALGALPERFPILERVARADRRVPALRLFPLALKAKLALNPKLRSQLGLVLYQTLGLALPEGAQAAAVLWGAAQFYAKRHPAAVRRAGITSGRAGLGEALFEAILTGESGVEISTHLHEEMWSFLRTPDRRVQLCIPSLIEELAALATEPEGADAEWPFMLMAGERRSYNANTIYRDPSWRKTDSEGALWIHPDDAEALSLSEGSRVAVVSVGGRVEALVHRNAALQLGVLSLPHGYGLEHPETEGGPRVRTGVAVNVLTSAEHCDPRTKTPFHKGVPVRLEAL
ncbi:MAG: molybdopterin-dependent oxidoreductase [Planctomycetes bacterium]|nr:molybdopterin-dependent oxidoreductase [Planctomycetota bacterium]